MKCSTPAIQKKADRKKGPTGINHSNDRTDEADRRSRNDPATSAAAPLKANALPALPHRSATLGFNAISNGFSNNANARIIALSISAAVRACFLRRMAMPPARNTMPVKYGQIDGAGTQAGNFATHRAKAP